MGGSSQSSSDGTLMIFEISICPDILFDSPSLILGSSVPVVAIQ
ncbi:hypothetical protein [Nitrosopumilus ureiphilus]|nr:hypothetical protein [Nitrosopumilus ureiphilus]